MNFVKYLKCDRYRNIFSKQQCRYEKISTSNKKCLKYFEIVSIISDLKNIFQIKKTAFRKGRELIFFNHENYCLLEKTILFAL